jgi:hypothetical protein
MGLGHPEYAATIYLLAKVHCPITLNVIVVFSHYLLQNIPFVRDMSPPPTTLWPIAFI